MESLQALASALGLGFLAGIRLYGTVLAIGVALRFELIHLPTSLAGLQVLADNRVLAIAAVAFAIEFIADKVPWIDSAWDSFHTFVRPVGAGVLAFTATDTSDPAMQWMLTLLAGGVAFAGHSSKAATRFAVNHSPEPFSNIGLSLAGDLALPVGVWLWAEHPYVLLGVVLVFLTIFAWLAPKLMRFIVLEWVALSSWVRSWWSGDSAPAVELPPGLAANLQRVLTLLRGREVALPARLAHTIQRRFGWRPATGIRCAAGRGRLRGSVGYLSICDERLVFVARRWFRVRVQSIPLPTVRHARLERRVLVDQLVLELDSGREYFDVFKAPHGERRTIPDGLATMD